MDVQETTKQFSQAARDLVVALAARDSFESYLEPFARRRAAVYASLTAPLPDADYWPSVATSLAPLAPPESMPMAGLIAAGLTLEGGARGLRGLFRSAPSEKERKRVQRVAALAARVMRVVADADQEVSEDETRAMAMTMASFGLNAEEGAGLLPTGPMTSAQLEIFGELDARVRRELVRGAWQVALRGPLKHETDQAVREIAAKLEASADSEALLTEARDAHLRLGDTCEVAVELTRGVAVGFPEEVVQATLEHLIRAFCPPSFTTRLRERLARREPVRYDALPKLERTRRVQACALAWASVVGTDPRYSGTLHLRAELVTAAGLAGAGNEVDEATNVVDRYLQQRVREASSAPAPADG